MEHIFEILKKIRESHVSRSKLLAEASGFEGLLSLIESNVVNKNAILEYAQEFSKVVGEIENWKKNSAIRKILEVYNLFIIIYYNLFISILLRKEEKKKKFFFFFCE